MHTLTIVSLLLSAYVVAQTSDFSQTVEAGTAPKAPMEPFFSDESFGIKEEDLSDPSLWAAPLLKFTETTRAFCYECLTLSTTPDKTILLVFPSAHVPMATDIYFACIRNLTRPGQLSGFDFTHQIFET